MKSKFLGSIPVFFLLTVAFSAPAFAWPFSDSKKTETKSSKSSVSAVSSSSQTSSRPQESSVSQRDNQGNSASQGGKAVPSLPAAPAKTYVSVNDPAEAGIDPDSTRIQKQIQEIMKINESLKANYSGQAAEIQRIHTQANMQKTILKDLNTTRKIAQEANDQKYSNKEKLRLLQEEAAKGQQYQKELNGLKRGPAYNSAKSSSTVPSESNKKV